MIGSIVVRTTLLLGLLLSSAAAAQERCPGLRALNGKCANRAAVADAQNRAMIVSTVRVSYFGTPIGTFGSDFIPFERLFRDDPYMFGLPTYRILLPCSDGFCVQRTK